MYFLFSFHHLAQPCGRRGAQGGSPRGRRSKACAQGSRAAARTELLRRRCRAPAAWRGQPRRRRRTRACAHHGFRGEVCEATTVLVRVTWAEVAPDTDGRLFLFWGRLEKGHPRLREIFLEAREAPRRSFGGTELCTRVLWLGAILLLLFAPAALAPAKRAWPLHCLVELPFEVPAYA